MVNNCLTLGQQALPTYRKHPQIFDFGGLAAYNAVTPMKVMPIFIGLF
jgi:hypothetical protein